MHKRLSQLTWLALSAVLLLGLGAPAYCSAIAPTAVWCIRAAGSNENGGFFDSAGAGTDTDYSQSLTPVLTDTDLSAINGSGTVTSASQGGFTAVMVKNGINIAGVYYEISARSSATSITVEPVYAGTTSSGLTGSVGGALATPGAALGAGVESNKYELQYSSSPYTVATAITPSAASSSFPVPNWLEGYNTTYGDITVGSGLARPTIEGTGSVTGILTLATGGWRIDNIILNANSEATTSCVSTSVNGSYEEYCNDLFTGFTTAGVIATSNKTSSAFNNCEFTSPGNSPTEGVNTGSTALLDVVGCYFHDFSGPAIVVNTNGDGVNHNIVANCQGSTSDGVQVATSVSNVDIEFNTIYDCGRDGVYFSAPNYPDDIVRNNIFVDNAGYGLSFPSTVGVNQPEFDGNAYYGNASGTRQNCGTGVLDQILTGSPFASVAVTSGSLSATNFGLNSTAGAGLACQGAASYPTWGSASTIGYADIGAVQHQATGGGSSGQQRRVWN